MIQEKTMEYRELKESELNKELFCQFNRYQEVKECMRKINGIWSAVKNPFTEQWKDEDYDVLKSPFIQEALCLEPFTMES